MRRVSDNGATAPISALTYAFSIGSDRGLQADDFEPRIIDSSPGEGEALIAMRREGDARCRTAAREATLSRPGPICGVDEPTRRHLQAVSS